MTREKQCTKCEKWFPATKEFFYKHKINKTDGLLPTCKECTKKQNREWAKNNPKKRKESYTKYNKNNMDKILESTKKRWEEGYYKKWQATEGGKEIMRRHGRKRRQSKTHEISKIEWEDCKKYFDYQCAYCGISEKEHRHLYRQDLHKEHVDHSGANDLSNCVPSCKACNSSKKSSSFKNWYNSDNENYSNERYNKIIRWLDGNYKNFTQ